MSLKILKNKIVYGNRLIDIWNQLPGKGMKKIDVEGNKIQFKDFGKKCSTGWQADHIIPRTKGGSNDISNMQPLQWVANIIKSNKLDFLNKSIHKYFLELNSTLKNKRSRGIRFVAGNTYWVHENSRVIKARIGTIINVEKKSIQIKWDDKTQSSVYPDAILFEKL